MLQTQPLYGISYAAVPKAGEVDVKEMTSFLDVLNDPDDQTPLLVPASKIPIEKQLSAWEERVGQIKSAGLSLDDYISGLYRQTDR